MSQLSVQFRKLALIVICLTVSLLAQSQTTQAPSATTAVPAMVKFSGTVPGGASGLVGLTFALYKDQQGGAPLWLETQSVPVDASGHYTVQLGATLPNGLPKELFASGEARWLGVQREGETEQPRALLLSVPYALKAADAETLGGLPASAFVLAAPAMAAPSSATSSLPATASAPPPNAAVTGTGTVNFVPLWDTTSDIVNSAISQTGTGATAKIGINTAAPTVTLDVKGASTIRGALTLPTTGTATATAGKNSQTLNLSGSAFNSGTGTAVNQTFRLQTEPVGNNTAATSGKLNLLYYSGANAASETGLSIASNGQITFAPGQAFPGTGVGTITGVTAGTALTGGGTTGTVTLNLDTTKVPLLNRANTFTGNQTVNGNLSATGAVTGSSFQIGSTLFAFGSAADGNAFLGFSGNSTMTGQLNTGNGALALLSNTTGQGNTASGYQALVANTTGGGNTASGLFALEHNTTGTDNTASGDTALQINTTGVDNTAYGAVALQSTTTGNFNTASGAEALSSNTTGSDNSAAGGRALANNTTGSSNTALGYNAGPDSAHTNLTNSTAIGANAVVTASNALVLGANGVNVGIGTSAPAFALDVHGTGNFTGAVTFAAGQTFPGTGTITGVTAGTALTGGGTSGGVTLNVDTTKVVTGITAGTDLTGGGTGGVQTLNLDTAKVPQLNTANTFTGSQTVNGNLSATGVVSGGSYQIGSTLFAFGSVPNTSAFIGFAGNTTNTGADNTGIGYQALSHLDVGKQNAAIGSAALFSNTGGNYNTAAGSAALFSNVSGFGNTATGMQALIQNTFGSANTGDGATALQFNTTGVDNTGIGWNAGSVPDGTRMTGAFNTFLGSQASESTGTLSNATAVGAQAQVGESNALVLGSIKGVNSATADTNVGIGITTPQALLHIDHAPPSGGQDLVMLTSGGGTDVASLLVQNTSTQGLRVRVGAGTSSTYVASSGELDFMAGDTGSPSFPVAPALLIGTQGNVVVTTGSLSIGQAGSRPFNITQGRGNAISDGWDTYSSRRWKTNIQTLPNALAKVEQLRGVTYDLKGSGKHEIGVIAEEVGQVVPEVVSFEANGKDAQGVDYSRLTAVLIEAVKEQQRQVRQQQAVLRAQAAMANRQQREIQTLKSQLRETRQSLQKIKAQVISTYPSLVAEK